MTNIANIIAKVASEILHAEGFQRIGASRTWIYDNGWWIAILEFQPSGTSKGTYLNLGLCWLWAEKNYPSFDFGYRELDFLTWNEDQIFEQEIYKYAQSARKKFLQYKRKFRDVREVYKSLKKTKTSEYWDLYNLAIVSGLCCDVAKFHTYYEQVKSHEFGEPDGSLHSKNLDELRRVVQHNSTFIAMTLEIVHRTRCLLALQRNENITFFHR